MTQCLLRQRRRWQWTGTVLTAIAMPWLFHDIGDQQKRSTYGCLPSLWVRHSGHYRTPRWPPKRWRRSLVLVGYSNDWNTAARSSPWPHHQLDIDSWVLRDEYK
jgi:hypothetical protein